jgi:hypothetical protein
MIPARKFLVRDKQTHRLGLVDTVVFPPLPGGRDLFVIWQGGLDYSVMGRDEVDIEEGTSVEHWQQLPPSILDHTPDGSSMPSKKDVG